MSELKDFYKYHPDIFEAAPDEECVMGWMLEALEDHLKSYRSVSKDFIAKWTSDWLQLVAVHNPPAHVDDLDPKPAPEVPTPPPPAPAAEKVYDPNEKFACECGGRYTAITKRIHESTNMHRRYLLLRIAKK